MQGHYLFKKTSPEVEKEISHLNEEIKELEKKLEEKINYYKKELETINVELEANKKAIEAYDKYSKTIKNHDFGYVNMARFDIYINVTRYLNQYSNLQFLKDEELKSINTEIENKKAELLIKLSENFNPASDKRVLR